MKQWKAAKEEMLEDEEEPENTYELLERKRQREIEVYWNLFIQFTLFWLFCFLTFLSLQEWYKQQITSGEAKDNANFQPLGGNWYGNFKSLVKGIFDRNS